MVPIIFSASNIPFVFFRILEVSSLNILCSSYISVFLQDVNSLLSLIIEFGSIYTLLPDTERSTTESGR